MSEVTYTVTGMRQVQVDVESGRVTVTSDASLPIEDVRAAVAGAGFELVTQ